MVFVHDGLVLSKSKAAITRVIKYVQSEFKITIGDTDQLVGFEIQRNRETKR